MSQVCSIFSQLLKLFPRAEFDSGRPPASRGAPRPRLHLLGTVRRHAVLPARPCPVLREICGGLAASQGKLRHLGLSAAPPRSTLAYANRQRPWQIYETVFQQLLAKCRGAAPGQSSVSKTSC